MQGNHLRIALTMVIMWGATFEVGHTFQTIVNVEHRVESGQRTSIPRFADRYSRDVIHVGEPGTPDVPWSVALIPEGISASADLELVITVADTIPITETIPPVQHDIITSDTVSIPPETVPDPAIYERDAWYPAENVRVLSTGRVGGREISTIAWSPYLYNPVQNLLVVIREASIRIQHESLEANRQGAPDTVLTIDKLSAFVRPDDHGRQRGQTGIPLSTGSPPLWTLPEDPALGIEYVVITSQALADAVTPLVRWKASRGINAGIATVEAIIGRYPSVDPAASVREYLKAAYGAGLTWVLLAGDETVVPTRLAYAGYKSNPTDPAEFQICDLYFAELDGEWDADGDGIFGEYFGDAAELYRELYVGRLPFSDATEAQVIIDKILAYERGPEDGSYLTRALGVCADQMRDWAEGTGQHQLVADVMPSSWTHNGESMVESPSGDNTAPVAPDGPSLLSLLADGFGYVNYFVHGRADGIVVRASGYSDWPKSYVWTFGSDGDGHGHLNRMTQTPFPGIHLSVGCNHGGFDMDTPPFAPGVQESVAERLLFTPMGGAAAFIGQSRWGWVSSSYKIIEEFYRLLADDSVPNHLGVYQALAVVTFPQYRDLNYGNNLYGDPEMPAWKDVPLDLNVEAPLTFNPGESVWSLRATEAGGAVSGALATISVGDSVWTLGLTDAGGELAASIPLPGIAEVVLTVSKPGHRTYIDTIPQSIITGILDDGSGLPESYQLLTNYPNPFNPATQFEFSLDRAGDVELVVYDILGRTIATVIDRYLDAGPHRASFAARNESGQRLPSGIYLARLKTGTRIDVRKMVLLR